MPDLQNCPQGFVCVPYQDDSGGACLPVIDNKKGLGEPCSSNEQCETNNCYPNAGGTWNCRATCDTDAQCPNGFLCFQVPGFATGGCLPEDQVPSFKVQDGDPCNADADCDSEICVLNPGSAGPKFCRPVCDPNAPFCSPGFECAPIGPGGGACVPAADGPPPLKPEGEACANGGECATDFCFGGVCKRACNVVSPTGCQLDVESCQRLQPDGLAGVCLERGPGAIGADCSGDTECGTRFCELAGNKTQCLDPCPVDGDCADPARTCVRLDGLTMLWACVLGGGPDEPDPTGDSVTGVDGDTTGGSTGFSDPIVTSRQTSGCNAGAGAGATWLVLGLLAIRRRRA